MELDFDRIEGDQLEEIVALGHELAAAHEATGDEAGEASAHTRVAYGTFGAPQLGLGDAQARECGVEGGSGPIELGLRGDFLVREDAHALQLAALLGNRRFCLADPRSSRLQLEIALLRIDFHGDGALGDRVSFFDEHLGDLSRDLRRDVGLVLREQLPGRLDALFQIPHQDRRDHHGTGGGRLGDVVVPAGHECESQQPRPARRLPPTHVHVFRGWRSRPLSTTSRARSARSPPSRGLGRIT